MAGAGDVDGDGLDDVILGDVSGAHRRGAAIVVRGARRHGLVPTRPPRRAGFRLTGRDRGADTGYAVDGGGDVNGDGLSDVHRRRAAGQSHAVQHRRRRRLRGLRPPCTARRGPPRAGPARDRAPRVRIRLGGVRRRVGGRIGGDRLDDVALLVRGSLAVVFGRRSAGTVRLDRLGPAAGYLIDGTVEPNQWYSDSASGGLITAAAVGGDADGDGTDDLLAGRAHGRSQRPAGLGVGLPVLPRRLLLGLSVVAVGVILFLGAAGVLDAGQVIGRWWPTVIVAAGVLTLAERPPSVYRALVLTCIGTILLLFTTGTVDRSAWDYLWPAAIVLAGLAILTRRRGRAIGAPARDVGDEVVRATGIFGGPHVASSAERFRGAWLTAVFGGVALDLRAARLDPEGAAINATAAFGGVEIIVPKGWRISVRSTPIFGGVDDKTDKTVHPDGDAPTLRVDAVAIFGGVEIKHEK